MLYCHFSENFCSSFVYKMSWHLQEIKKDNGGVCVAMLCLSLIYTTSAHDVDCRDKLIGEDNCGVDKLCSICDGLSDAQKEIPVTPSYKIRKDKKAGLLVSPKDVTVLQPLDQDSTFQSPSGQSAQPSVHPSSPLPSFSSAQVSNFITSEQLSAISDKWAEQFSCMEALLSRGNVFSTPVSAVNLVDTQVLISDKPFLAPATCPGPVEVLVGVDASGKEKSVESKTKKKFHKSRKDKPSDKPLKTESKVVTTVSKPEKNCDTVVTHLPLTSEVRV